MDIVQFFEKVLPAEGHGHHILVCKQPYASGEKGRDGKPKCYWVTRAFNDFKKMAALAQKWSAAGKETYHACASFKEINWETKINQKSGESYTVIADTRTQVNAAFTRAQWLDIDVGPGKDYETREEALTALAAVCRVLKIPMPMVVSSGRTGLHCYWAFVQDLPAATAALLMGSFLLALEAAGFNHDTSRTADTASVLRPIGTLNHKGSKPVAVKLLSDAPAVDPREFYKPFAKYLNQAKLLRSPNAAAEADLFDELNAAIRAGATISPRVRQMGSPEKWEAIDRDTLFVPYSIKLVAPHCAVVKEFVQHRPDMEPLPEPVWRGLLGLIAGSREGRPMAHKLSARSDDRYDHDVAENYMDRWPYGPTSCKYFSGVSTKCATCPHLGTITSPKSLGEIVVEPTTVEPQAAVAPTAQPVAVKTDVNAYAALWPSEKTLPFWDDEQYRANMATGRMQRPTTKKELDENPALPAWVDFARKIYYPYFQYYDHQESKYMIKCCVQSGDAVSSANWRKFELDASVTNDANQLSKALGAQGVHYMGTKNKNSNLAYVQDILQGLKRVGLEAESYTSFGWHDDGFVLGDTFLTGTAERPVFLSKDMPNVLQGTYGRAGTVDGWVSGIDRVYNRPGAEPYQFILLAAFASPLVHLSNPGGLWHGVVVGLTGNGGLGKTTTCKVACSAFGNPSTSTIQANDEGTTLNALVQRVGTHRHLPLVLDEVTGRKLEDIQSILYSITSGKPKNRCEQSGVERSTTLEWALIPFLTGNINVTALLSQAEAAKQTATQVRCFEIRLPPDFNARVFGDIDAKEVIEHELLGQQYGEVGIQYLQYVTRNKEKIAARLRKVRGKLSKRYGMEHNAERFYYDLIATVVVAGQICKHLGLIHFDTVAVRDWALQHIEALRQDRKDTQRTTSDYLQALLSDMHRRTVVTKHWNEGRAKYTEDPDDASYIQSPCARRATESKRYLIKKTAVIEWCIQNKLDYADFIDQLRKDGVIVPPIGGKDKASLFSGLTSNIGLGGGDTQPRVWEFKYAAVADVVGDSAQHVRAKVTNIR